MDEPQRSVSGGKFNLDARPRTLGALLLAFGLIFGFVAFYFPIQDALARAPKISLHPKAIFACVIFTILGFTFIILGPIAIRLTYKVANLKGWKKWLALGAVAFLTIISAELVQHVFEQYLGAFGYKF